MKIRLPSLPEGLTLLCILLLQKSLPQGWYNSPPEKLGWLVFLLWTAPIFYYRLGFSSHNPKEAGSSPLLFGAAIITALIACLTSVNSGKNLAFAMALAALLPPSWHHLPWLLSSLAWMRPVTYWGIHAFPQAIPLVKMSLIALPTLWTLFQLYKKEARHEIS